MLLPGSAAILFRYATSQVLISYCENGAGQGDVKFGRVSPTPLLGEGEKGWEGGM